MTPQLTQFERSIEDVVETIQKAKARNSKCSLLIGAGCSRSAGIPLASEFVEIISKEYPRAYRYAKPCNYATCMAQLSHSERKSLISKHIDAAKLNWAHIAIAQLVHDGVVDRVLTTNFDPLVVRACALIGEYPAVYDAASSQISGTADIHDRSIFYLHGQRTGFKILNTDDEVQQQYDNLLPVFDEAGVDRVWVIVGYSGTTDPVFEHLVRLGTFKNNLYWICFKDSLPPDHVAQKLLKKGVGAFYVRGHDADNFLVRLAQECGAFPPVLFKSPEKHLQRIQDTILPFPLADDVEGSVSATEQIERLIKLGVQNTKRTQKKSERVAAEALELFTAGDYARVVDLWKENERLRNKSWMSLAAASMGQILYQMRVKMKTIASPKLDVYFDEAKKAHVDAIALFPKNIQVTCAYVYLIVERTRCGELPDRDRINLLREAEPIGKRAIHLDHESVIALAANGRLYLEKAHITRAADDYLQAHSFFRQAVNLKDDNRQSLVGLGIVAIEGSYVFPETDRLKFLSEGEAALLKLESLEEGSSSYNLACLYAVVGDPEKTQKWLRRSIEQRDAPSIEYVRNDRDFAKFKGESWFQELLQSADKTRPAAEKQVVEKSVK